MRLHFLPLLLTAGLLACGSQSAADAETDEPPTERAAGATPTGSENVSATATSMTDPGATQSAPQQEKGPYRLVGVIDPEMNNTVSFALKVPREWQVKQTFKRSWNGAVPSSRIYLSFTAPGGDQQIEYLPAVEYTYMTGPSMDNMRAQMQSMGMGNNKMSSNELAPMSAMAYLKQVLLPELAKQGLQLRNLGNEHAATLKPEGQVAKSSAYIDGTLPNGRKARVEARLFQTQARNGNDTFYSWQVVPSITQTSGDLTATYAHTKVAQESIVRNPAWQKANNEVVQRGMQMNSQQQQEQNQQWMEVSRRNHEMRMNDIRQAGEANTARYNERMAQMDQQHAAYMDRSRSQDQQHEYYVDNAIRGETKYENPTTGERVKVDNTYNHVYTDNQGRYYGSNTPIDAGQVNWQELSKVAQKDY